VVKITHWPVGEIFTWIHWAHIPEDLDPAIRPWHLVHEYTGDIYDYMATVTWSYALDFPDPDAARICALDLAANSQVVTDMCFVDHPSGPQFFGPLHYPRWNIYRGQRGEPIVPCFYWDIYNPDPPPGYQWAYPYPFPPP
jgi:hypothetical protein